jgi:aminoglycoside phosphotransferase (APT) family kinase protein
MNETVARLHLIDPGSVGLGDFGRPGNFMERHVARWSKQYRAAETEPIAAMDHLIPWLGERIPAASEVRIVHGDFRMDNLIVHPTEPRVAAVLDWELSTLGDPVADFAYHAMAWRISPDLFRGLAGVDYAGLGIPDEPSYVASYCERTGRTGIADWEFYIVFSMFRMAAILQGIAKRALEGSASSSEALSVGRRARPIAEQAWALAQAARG